MNHRTGPGILLGVLLAAVSSWTGACGKAAPEGGADSGGSSAGSGEGDCSALPACEFACPEGTSNPVDAAGCTHTCECVRPGTAPGSLKLYSSCGDPVCRGYTAASGVPLCSSEAPGGVCRVEGAQCDPQDSCNSLIVCASTDPRMGPGGCPISRREYKADIHYLSAAELVRYERELRELRLATWRYAHDPSKTRLGIIIDDNESSVAVDAPRDMVDLYGYTSLAVAALQLQAQQIEALKAEVAALKKDRARPTGGR